MNAWQLLKQLVRHPVTALRFVFSLDRLGHFITLKTTDEKRFSRCLRQAKKGDAKAQNEVGMMYYTGVGLARDVDQAVEWYERSAQQGDPEGQNKLGLMYEKGISVVQDDDMALSWYQQSAEQGFSTAQYNLARMYADADGDCRNDVLAKMWSDIAIANGLEHVQALSRLLEQRMTSSQLEESGRLASEWLQSH
jgi:TPR repeat protein